MEKKKGNGIIETAIIFLLFTGFAIYLGLVDKSLDYDLIWCFHMSQKVSNGYRMYLEISTVVMPIYFWLGGLFVKIFGNFLITMAIYGGVVWGTATTVLYKIVEKIAGEKNKFAMPLFLLFLIQIARVFYQTNYNSLAIMWIIIALYLELKNTENQKKLYNYLIGMFLAFAFFTKQNIGTYGVLATGIVSLINGIIINKANPIKEIMRKASGFLIVFALICCHFVMTDTFNELIYYCIGGLLEFGSSNVLLTTCVNNFMIIVIGMAGYFITKEQKNKIDVVLIIYFTLMCLVTYPLMNTYHVMMVMIFASLLVIRLLNRISTNENIYKVFVMIVTLWWMGMYFLFPEVAQSETEILFACEGKNSEIYLILFNMCVMMAAYAIAARIISEKANAKKIMLGILLVLLSINIGEYYLNVKTIPNVEIKGGKGIYKNHGYDEKIISYINNVIKYIQEKENEGYKVYVVSADASYYMAELNRNQYKYDLVLYGSLGYGGEKLLMEETSQLEDNALILKDKNLMWQEPKDFDKYIKEKYKKIDEVENLIVYTKIVFKKE